MDPIHTAAPSSACPIGAKVRPRLASRAGPALFVEPTTARNTNPYPDGNGWIIAGPWATAASRRPSSADDYMPFWVARGTAAGVVLARGSVLADVGIVDARVVCCESFRAAELSRRRFSRRHSSTSLLISAANALPTPQHCRTQVIGSG